MRSKMKSQGDLVCSVVIVLCLIGHVENAKIHSTSQSNDNKFILVPKQKGGLIQFQPDSQSIDLNNREERISAFVDHIKQKYELTVLRQFKIGQWYALLVDIEPTKVFDMDTDNDIDYVESNLQVKAFDNKHKPKNTENNVFKSDSIILSTLKPDLQKNGSYTTSTKATQPPEKNKVDESETQQVTTVGLGAVCFEQTAASNIWALPRISSHSLPSYSRDHYMFTDIDTGDGVDIYIADTGIRTTHDEFEGRASFGYKAQDLDENNDDGNGHGTHVSSLAIGQTVGAAKGARAISIKVLDSNGVGQISWIIEGLQWVVDQVEEQRNNGNAPKSVISLSLGVNGISYTLDDALQNIIQEVGIPVVAAAGNDNADSCENSPARIASVITVGATTDSDSMTSFSNYGPCVDILSPGEGILGAYAGADDEYASLSGTSQATPFVAGIIARYLSSVNDDNQPTPAFLKAYITDTASYGYVSFISSNQRTTPNRLIYRACESLGSDLPDYRPSFPSSGVSGGDAIHLEYIIPLSSFGLLLISFIIIKFESCV